MKSEEVDFQGDSEVLESLATIKKNLAMKDPDRFVKDLNAPVDTIEWAHHR